ncbi:MAG: hypothetical protein DRG69_01440 [Deltaproteobacteria bacterium]|nr:MAG: hypothetical protein DRG69_01440 [Deltaproteobacteria bacterium]
MAKGFRALLLSLFINLLIFSSMPFLLQGEVRVSRGPLPEEGIRVHLRPPPPPAPSPPPKGPEELPQSPKRLKVPRVCPKVPVESRPPQLELDPPAFALEITPELAQGISLSPPPPAPSEVTFEAEEVDEVPVPVEQPKPIYPLRARRAGVEGFVKVRFLVDRRGRVGEVEVLEASPEGYFERAAQDAVRRWRFVPGKVRGRPVETWVAVTIRFRLEGG